MKTMNMKNHETNESSASTFWKAKRRSRKKWSAAIAIGVASIMLVSAPISMAASPSEIDHWGQLSDEIVGSGIKAENIEYAIDHKTGNRIGIKSFDLDGLSYYDIYGGEMSSADKENKTKFYTNALTKSDPKCKTASPMEYWSQLAYSIFKSESSYSSHDNPAKDFDGWWSGDKNEGGGDLVKYLQEPNAGSRMKGKSTEAKVGKDGTYWTGLRRADSLAKVRSIMANQIADGITKHSTIDGDYILDNTEEKSGLTDGKKSMALDKINNSKTQDVMYSIVTNIERDGSTPLYRYNSYGIAFYDFKFAPIAADNLEYVTAIEGHETVKEAAESGVKNVTYEDNGGEKDKMMYTARNESATPSKQTVKEGLEKTSRMTNSVTTKEQYTFTESAWGGAKFGVNCLGYIGGELWVGLEAQQMFGTEEKKEMTEERKTDGTHTVDRNLPGHTLAPVKTSKSEIIETMTYDFPVTISYKVAIFSLSGDVYFYNDGCAIQDRHMKTAGYWQKHFCTTFGECEGEACKELKKRSEDSIEEAACDRATYGYKHKRGSSNHSRIRQLNWGVIKDKENKAKSKGKQTVDFATLSQWLYTSKPMSAFGAKLTSKLESNNIEVMDLIPIYPLTQIKYQDGTSKINYELEEGQTIELINENMEKNIQGFNAKHVEYHGFKPLFGKWVLKNEGTNESEVISLSYPEKGTTCVTAMKEGTAMLKYVIDEGKYTSHEGSSGKPKTASNESLDTTVYIDIKVKPKPLFNGTVKVRDFTEKVGQCVDLNTQLVIRDKDDNIVNFDPADVQWEKEFPGEDGIVIDENNVMTLNKAGKYKIRASYLGIRSEWANVRVLPATEEPVPEELEVLELG